MPTTKKTPERYIDLFFFCFFRLGALAKVSSATPGWHSLTGCPRDALTHRESEENVSEAGTIDANTT